jgi:translation initiation factor IF-2
MKFTKRLQNTHQKSILLNRREMQEQKSPSGKLESIKKLAEMQSSLDSLREHARDAKFTLDNILVELRQKRTEIFTKREEAVRREETEKKYADLIKQREAERRLAEVAVDAKAKELAQKRAARQAVAAKPAAKPTQIQPVSKPAFAPRQEQPRFQTQQQQKPPYTAHRTWTPNQSTNSRPTNTYGGGRPFDPNRPRPPFDPNRPRPPFDPNRPRPASWGPRPPFDPNRPRPPFDPNRPRPPFDPNRPRPVGARAGGGSSAPTERFIPKPNTAPGKKKRGGYEGEEKSSMDRRSLLRRGIIEEHEIEERMLTRMFRNKKSKENSGSAQVVRGKDAAIVINTHNLTVKLLSEKIGKTAAEIIKQLMVLGQMCTINSALDFGTAELVAMEFGIKLELHSEQTSEEKMRARHKKGAADEAGLEPRPPVVTVMGHVDHGKTSLLDALRKTNVTARESGGITQHIGAYQVTANGKKITFIDTPGHEAFDKMRARGAKLTDIAILVVAADDGVMPQTVEAIKHIQSQEIPMIVAINKMDKKGANPDRIIEQLSGHNVVAEQWGGNAIIVPISATAGTGLDKLLEMILLVADMNGYKANPNKEAQGSIIDARLDKTRGATVTVLVKSGTLKVGDTLLAGTTYGKVRGMTDENGKVIKKAGPSAPVVVLGFNEVPRAGDAVYVVDEKLTKEVVSERKVKEQVKRTEKKIDVTGIDALAKLQEAAKTHLNVIIKGDVSGSVEAIIQTLENITSDEVGVSVISSGVGAVNDNDVALAQTTGALLIAFNVKTTPTAKHAAENVKIKIHEYKVVYEIFDFVTEQMVRKFKPKFETVYLGKVEVRALFKSSAVGLIAGCMVVDGRVTRGSKVKLLRGGTEVGQYKIESVKIKTNDVKEVLAGFECGIKLEGTVDIKVGDIFEVIGVNQLPIIFNGKKYEF